MTTSSSEPGAQWYATVTPRSPITTYVTMGVKPGTKGYDGFALVVNCEEHIRRTPLRTYTGVFLHYPMLDDNDWPLDAVSLVAIVDHIKVMVANEQPVLVHCTGGLNRSGVVVGEYLKSTGLSGREAVDWMREARDQYVLCNPAFERFVLRDDG